MSEKYIKLQSQQNGQFTATNNRVDFIIPASMGKVSMKDSFVQLYCKIDAVEANPASGTGVYIGSLRWKNGAGASSNNYFNNVGIVKNAHISSANKGMIESVRRTDILRQNMDTMRQSQTNVDSNRYMVGDSLRNMKNDQQYSIFVDINKTGNVASVNNQNVPVMIRLGDILNFCDVDVIDMGKMGDTRIHLELNLGNIEAYQVFPDVLTNGDKVNDIAQPAVNTAITQLTTSTLYTNLDQSSWYVGQKLEYTGTVNGAGGTTAKAVITNIVENANGSLTLTFDRTLFTLTTTGGGATGGTLDVETPTSLTPDFNRMECVLKTVPQEREDVENVLYTQFDTYELLGNASPNYTNVVEIDGNAENMIIMPIDTNDIDAKLTTLSDFRIALNNVELTDSRNVLPYTPLYYDRLVSGMGKADYVVKNLQNPLYDIISSELYGADQSMILVMPLFQTTNPRKNLQININSGGLNRFVLYTAVPRVLSL